MTWEAYANLGLVNLGEERGADRLLISGKYVTALDLSDQPGLASQREGDLLKEKRPTGPFPQVRRVRKKLAFATFVICLWPLSLSYPAACQGSVEHQVPRNHVYTGP